MTLTFLDILVLSLVLGVVTTALSFIKQHIQERLAEKRITEILRSHREPAERTFNIVNLSDKDYKDYN